MKVLQIILTGLGTDPKSPTAAMMLALAQAGLMDADALDGGDCGMEKTAEMIADTFPGYDHVIEAFAWDGGTSPNDQCTRILALIQLHNPAYVILHGHSFGCSLLVFLVHWLARWHSKDGPTITAAFGYDPCQHMCHFGDMSWGIGDTYASGRPVVAHAWTWFNTDPWRVPFVVGTPFNAPAAAVQTIVTPWTGPKLAHVDWAQYVGIPNSARVRQMVLDALTPILQKAA